MDIEMDDCELDEIVEGECFRLGAGVPLCPSLLSLSLLWLLLWTTSTRGKAARKNEGGGMRAKWKKKERGEEKEVGLWTNQPGP